MLDSVTCLDRLRAISDGKATLPEIRDALVHSRRDIRELFANEEDGGYLREALKISPERNREASELRRQHGEFLVGLSTILKAVDDRSDADSLGAQVNDWLEAFSKHEMRERALLQEAFNIDLGTGD